MLIVQESERMTILVIFTIYLQIIDFDTAEGGPSNDWMSNRPATPVLPPPWVK